MINVLNSWDNWHQFSSEFYLSFYALFSSWPTTFSELHLDGPEGQVELLPNGYQANDDIVSATVKILNTLTTHTISQLLSISPLIPPPSSPPAPPVVFSSKDIRRARLNPFSALDVVYFLGLAAELSGGREVRLKAESALEWIILVLGSY